MAPGRRRRRGPGRPDRGRAGTPPAGRTSIPGGCPGSTGTATSGTGWPPRPPSPTAGASPANGSPTPNNWFTGNDFEALAASCRALQRRAGVPQRRRGRGATTVPAGLAALGVTTREADVLTLVAAGLTNQQIADRLYISPRTVKSHLETLLRKTGSTGRTQLATLASRSRTRQTPATPTAKPAGRPMSRSPCRPDDSPTTPPSTAGARS